MIQFQYNSMINSKFSNSRILKSLTIKNEYPDTLINLNSSIKQPEKLLNVRKYKKRMTRLHKNIDLPDNLLGFDEYKEISMLKDIHISREIKTSGFNPDLPDILEPINGTKYSNLPKPYKIIKTEEKKIIKISQKQLEELMKFREEKQKLEECFPLDC